MANSMNSGLRNSTEQSQETQFNSKVSEMSSVSKRYDALVGEFDRYQMMLNEISKKSSLKRLQEELKQENLSANQKKIIRQQIADEEARIQQLALDATLAYTVNTYKKATVARKLEIKKEHADALVAHRAALDKEYQEKWAAAQGDAKERRRLTNQHKKDVFKNIQLEREARAQVFKLEQSESHQQYKNVQKHIDNFKKDKSFKNGLKIAVSVGQLNIDSLKKMAEESKKAYQDSKKETERRAQDLEDLKAQGFGEHTDEYKEALAAYEQSRMDENNAALKKVLEDELSKVADALMTSFAEVESMITDYKGHVDARLQGSDKSYNKINDLISSNLSTSPFVKTQKVLENMRELVDKGVAYNVEQRAFLQTVSDKIANTFDTFDANLLRLIRLQQADTTAARLGMEASLTKFLNGMFQDTSYLSDVYDSVSAAIIDANATMTRNMSAEFEYIVQKWLGALSSVGMSSETINQIATGINYLATGDVQSLASNTQLQTLFAMSASNAGLSYSDLLLKGLDSSSTNKLLESMVSYLKQIAENSDNQVVRAAYGDIFNLSMSDMKAISNLSSGDISSIAGNKLSYGGMQSELTNQFAQLLTRTSLTEMMSNVYNNAVFGVAEDLISNPVSYAMYKMLNYMREQEVDINIPFINAMGFGLDLNASVGDLMNMGLQIGGAMSLISNILSGLGSMGGLNLNAWEAQEYTKRGSGMSFSMGGVQGGTSGSTYISTSNSTDMKNSTLNSSTDDAEETKEITNKNTKSEHTFDDFYKVTVTGSEGSGYIRTFDSNLAVVFGTESLRIDDKLKVYDYHLDDYRYADGTLGVYDKSIDKYKYSLGSVYKLGVVDSGLAEIFNKFKFNTEEELKVHDEGILSLPSADNIASKIADKQLKVVPNNTTTITTAISTAAATIKAASSSVTITGAPKVTLDKATLVTAFKEALGHKEGTKTDADYKTISDLYRLLIGTVEDEQAHVRIQNEDGQRLQVDTETGGTAMYALNPANLKW